MNPSNPFGPQDPAMPSIPPATQQAGNFDAPTMSGMDTTNPIPSMAPPMNMDTVAATAAPAMTGAAASWLPPTVPVQAGTAGNSNSGSQTDASGSSSPSLAAPDVADDGDIIEKEWVDKAKHIVATTRQDPYKQARELHKFKAEYLQKRYNKTIEAVED